MFHKPESSLTVSDRIAADMRAAIEVCRMEGYKDDARRKQIEAMFVAWDLLCQPLDKQGSALDTTDNDQLATYWYILYVVQQLILVDLLQPSEKCAPFLDDMLAQTTCLHRRHAMWSPTCRSLARASSHP